jgi:hypothetical protein
MEPDVRQVEKSWVHANKTTLSASIAAFTTVIAGSPFDSVKVRMQTRPYTSTYACIIDTFKTEGLKGFFVGMVPPLISVNLVKMVAVTVYEDIRMSMLNNKYHPYLSYFGAGALAGASVSLMSCPLEMIRNHRITTNAQSSLSFAQHLREIYRGFGFRYGLYNGYTIHLLRDTLGTGSYWLLYETIHSREKSSGAVHFLAGGATGMLSWIVIYPLDLIKNIYQQQRFKQGHATYQAVFSQVRAKGLTGLYRGVWPTMLRAFPVHGLNLFVYETCLNLLDGY